MGFFDNIIGAFTGSTTAKAAEQARQYLAQQQADVGKTISGAQGSGIEALRSGALGAREALGTGFDTVRGDIAASLDPARQALIGYTGQGVDALRSGAALGAGAIDAGTAQALGLLGGAGAGG